MAHQAHLLSIVHHHHITKQQHHKPIAIPIVKEEGCFGRRFGRIFLRLALTSSKRVKSAKSKSWDVIACVAVNDVFVMRAWGEIMAVGEIVMMLFDGCGDLSRALGCLWF